MKTYDEIRLEKLAAIRKQVDIPFTEEQYKEIGFSFRHTETTVTDIVKMVEQGLPINGLSRSFETDDDEEGASDSDPDDEDFKKMESLHRDFFDDDLMMIQELSERNDRQLVEEEMKKITSKKNSPEVNSEGSSEGSPEEGPVSGE